VFNPAQASDYRFIQALHIDRRNCGEDLLIHCIKLFKPCAAGLDRPKGFYYAVLQETQASEGLIRTYITTKPMISDHNLEKR